MENSFYFRLTPPFDEQQGDENDRFREGKKYVSLFIK